VKLRGRWGTVYDDAWNMDDAEVVCQQLGCGSAAHAQFTSQLLQDHSALMLIYINCNGNEKAIWDCNIEYWDPYNIPVLYNASVVCQGFSRLAGGDSECSGRLEVRQGQAWVSICHGHVDLMAAQVVCRELGCGTALALPEAGHFGATEGPFWHGAFECNGTEPLLSACTQRPPDIQNCTQPAAVICSRKCRGVVDLLHWVPAGRVEVKHEGEWGSVCSYDFDWDIRGASVVCRQLGCGRVAHTSPYAIGQGKGRIWLQPFLCRGTETKLQNCPHFGWGKHFCGHEWDVGVICSEALELRLEDGWGPCEGRVEVKLQGRWGTVADNAWDMDDAEVVCQQLGCGSAAGAYLASRFRSVDGPIMMAFIDCHGDEAALWGCNIWGWGPYNGPHDYDTAVVCQGFSRLVGGDSECSGRLEVWQGQAW
ncbi:LOW QUALITY PROTEIN: scavenger receptor cysteine-rich type 1 protein M130-like, partial [Meleagris gallopavo]|uniref:LOW QUALITY PROTEIN: scavenger receptor cysteine-rich type 1 protein M130-like n=1 Tax=Meleagris gallopavo TaxID=9103 RepID=UPI0012AB72D0